MAYQFPTQSVLDATPYRGVAYYNALNESARPPGWDATAGAQKALGYADLVALGSLPVVLNNLEKTADPYLDTLDSIDQGYKNLNSYVDYSNTAQLLDPSGGQEKLAYTLSPGTITGTALDLGISAINPWFGLSRFANTLTQNEENPGGRIPVLSHIQDGIDYTTDAINNTAFGKGVRSAVRTISDPIYDHVLDTRLGRPLYETATLPMEFVESGGNLFRETGEFIDRSLFGGYLPGLANDDDPSTQEWNNPFENFTKALEGIPGSYRTKREINADSAYESFDLVSQGFIDGIVNRGNDYVDIVEGFDSDRLAVIESYFSNDIDREKAVAILNNSDYLSSVIEDPEAWAIDPTGYFEERDPGPLKTSELNIDPKNFKIHDDLAPSFQKTLVDTIGEEETKHIMGKDFMDLDVLRWFDEETTFDQAYDFDKQIRPLYYDSNDYKYLNSELFYTDGELKKLSATEGFDVDEVKRALDFQEETGREEFRDRFNDLYDLSDSSYTQSTVDELNQMKSKASQFDGDLASDITGLTQRAQQVVNVREADRLASIDYKKITDGQLSQLNDLARSFDSSNPALAKQYDDKYFTIQKNKVAHQIEIDRIAEQQRVIQEQKDAERLRQIQRENASIRAAEAQRMMNDNLNRQIARDLANTNHYNHATRTPGNRFA
mgnify:CR=1 FL=1